MEVEGCRRLWALVKGLPSDAAVWREDQPGWTRQDEFLAVAIEAIDHWGRGTVTALTRKAPRDPQRLFEHEDRPEAQRAKLRTISPGEFARQNTEHLRR